MRKQGPCYHCGTQNTPLWRNGPAEKPVLCNACGSRYRIRGTLENYAPKHAQAQHEVPINAKKRSKLCSNNKSNKSNLKLLQDDQFCYSDHNDSSSHKSISSDSALSYPLASSINNVKEEHDEEEEEDCSPQLLGGEIEAVKKSQTPSRKRSSNLRPIEKLQKDLLNIMKYEHKSMSPKDDDLLIYNANSLQVSPNEIGIGSILLKPNHV